MLADADDTSRLERDDGACRWCRSPTRATRADAIYCSRKCRQAAWRFMRGVRADVADGHPRHFAYADPPYPGKAHEYYRDHPDYAGEVDHAQLVATLRSDYPDGWALSTSSRSLRYILSLLPGDDIWVGAWTKPVPPQWTSRPRSAWEPVIFAGGRRIAPATTVTDWVHAAPMRSYPGAIVGTKPPVFSEWIFASLGVRQGDRLDDLYPGSGAVAHAFAAYTSPAPRHDGS